MGTKNDPGPYDCHAKAEDDEPLFTLLARDPLGHAIVELWAHLRSHDISSAVFCFGYLVAQTAKLAFETNTSKIDEAFQCADDMRAWFKQRQH